MPLYALYGCIITEHYNTLYVRCQALARCTRCTVVLETTCYLRDSEKDLLTIAVLWCTVLN